MQNEEGLIVGRNAVTEALKSGREIDTLFVAKGERSGSMKNTSLMGDWIYGV